MTQDKRGSSKLQCFAAAHWHEEMWEKQAEWACDGMCAQVGFMLIDELARQLGAHMDKLQHNAAVGRGRFCNKRVLLAKPMTFMNNSGESVGKLARYYKVLLLHATCRIFERLFVKAIAETLAMGDHPCNGFYFLPAWQIHGCTWYPSVLEVGDTVAY